LPLLPDRAIDPWGALNPYKLWLLVILISSLSLVGYVLTRWLGPTRGAALTGLTGGLVSSTAVTLSFSKEAREKPQEATALACGILLSWMVMFVRVIVLVAIVNRALLTRAVSVCCDGCHRRRLCSVSLFSRRIAQRQACQKEFESRESVQPDRRSEIRRTVRGGSPRDQVRAGAFPPSGLYADAALAGLIDVDAITCKPLAVATAATLIAGLAAAFFFQPFTSS